MSKEIMLLVAGLIGLSLIKKANATTKAKALASGFWSTIPENKRDLKGAFDEIEMKYNIPNNLLAKIGWRESRFDPDVISGKKSGSSGEYGLMQIYEKYHPDFSKDMSVTEQIDYAASYLRKNYDRFNDWQLAVMAYNWGPTNVANWIKGGRKGTVPAVTKSYIKEVF